MTDDVIYSAVSKLCTWLCTCFWKQMFCSYTRNMCESARGTAQSL